MTHDERFPLEDFGEEPVEFEVKQNVPSTIRVRFTRDEIRELGQHQRETGVLPTTFIHDYTLAAIRANRAARMASQAEVAD